MAMSLIIYLIIFFVVVYLIFKFIKKVIFAIFATIALVILIIGGIGALIYSDVNNLTSHQDYDVKVLYAESGEDYLFGVSLPINNQSLDFEGVESLSKSEINDLDVDEVDDEGNEFVIIVDDERFEMLVTEDSYDLNNMGNFDFSAFGEYDLILSKNEILDIIKSENGEEILVDILLTKNKITGLEGEMLRSMLIGLINDQLNEVGLSFREALFLLIISESMSDSEGIVNIVEGYKGEEIEIYPNRISFRFLKLLPASTIKSFLFDDSEIIEE